MTLLVNNTLNFLAYFMHKKKIVLHKSLRSFYSSAEASLVFIYYFFFSAKNFSTLYICALEDLTYVTSHFVKLKML